MKIRELLVWCALLSIPAQAGVIISGTNTLGQPVQSGTGNCDPFGCPAFFGLKTYEQIYSNKAFPDVVDIGEIAFFDTQVHNGGQPGGGIFTLSFAYTGKAIGGLDLNQPTNNIASGSETFFTGILPTLVNGTLSFQGTPFNYDPAQGNLLLTVSVTGGSNGAPFLYLDQAAARTATSNAYFGTYLGQPVSGGNNIGGLVTEFSYGKGATAPEPGSLMLICAGMLFAGCMAMSRRLRAR